MKKYFFVAFKTFNGKSEVGGGDFVVVCSCSLVQMEESLLSYYNENAGHKADKVIITALTILDKHTAAQLSENLTNGALIIDDGDNEEEKKMPCIERWIARDKDGTLCLYWGENPPTKKDMIWDYNSDYEEIDCSLFPEVKWSDEEPTKVKLIIDKQKGE